MPTSAVVAVEPSCAYAPPSHHHPSSRDSRLGLFGIEHLSIDPAGDVRWRGVIVEQLQTPSWQQSSWRRWMRAEAVQLAAVCREIEEHGIRPSLSSVCGW
jgi:hypothetical protein